MTPNDIRGAYILYIGAGAVAAGGVISLIRSLPTILHGLKGGLADFHLQRSGGSSGARTDRDLSIKFVAIGIILLIAAIRFAGPLHMNLIGALLIVLFGFLFVTVSSRLTGEIGSSSNPISGMTVATLLLTCLAFLVLGWTTKGYYVTALSVGAIVCIASSNGGSTSQDLKTGFLVGGTPRYQQMAILLGAFASALVLGPILMTLNDAKTVYVPVSKVAPELRANISELGKTESIRGIQASDDTKSYRVWQKTDTEGGPAGKYVVDETGNAVWLVDPGINGAYRASQNQAIFLSRGNNASASLQRSRFEMAGRKRACSNTRGHPGGCPQPAAFARRQGPSRQSERRSCSGSGEGCPGD